MVPRSTGEEHRAATPLELFFDLVFVVAIAQAANALHHGIAGGHAAEAVLSYVMAFFAIWWAWMNFTWFASAYDPDDVPYRLVVFVQLTGALLLAAGIPDAFATNDWRLVAIGYVVMRLALVTLWLRAARADPDPGGSRTARRYAIGIVVAQLLWVALIFSNVSWVVPGFFALVVLEMAVPAWAERTRNTSWNAEHIAERYGLLTIIVLGEAILAASIAIASARADGGITSPLVEIIAGGLLIVFSMWWLYFFRPAHDLLTNYKASLIWGYGHYAVFAAGAAVGAGLAIAVDVATDHAELDAVGAGAAVAVPAAIYLVGLWYLHQVRSPEKTELSGLIAALLVLATPFTGHAVLATGLVLAGLLTVKLTHQHRSAGASTFASHPVP